MKLVAIGELALIARDHVSKLTPDERRRFVELLRLAKGRPSRLSRRKRDELTRLAAKAEPKLFAREAVDKLSPVPLPGRFVRGSDSR